MFFFKLKTAYEVRISCWISDVCSSDLCRPTAVSGKRPAAVEGWRAPRACGCTVGQRDGRQPSSTRHGRHGHGAIIRRSTARTGARRASPLPALWFRALCAGHPAPDPGCHPRPRRRGGLVLRRPRRRRAENRRTTSDGGRGARVESVRGEHLPQRRAAFLPWREGRTLPLLRCGTAAPPPHRTTRTRIDKGT